MFTAYQAICGALLIQFATSAFFAEAGRTVGFSSIAWNTVARPSLYPVTIVIGLTLSTVIISHYMPQFLPPAPSHSVLYTAISGALVGFGTNWGSGCTSGHMLCGLSLLRVRSLVATVVFVTTAMLVVNIFDLAPSCGDRPCYELASDEDPNELWQIGLSVVAAFFVAKLRLNRVFTGLKTGLIFGLGLYFTGMANPSKPQGFLSVFHLEKFDPTLALIIPFAILPNMIEWFLVRKTEPKPAFENRYALPTATEIPLRFLIGSALFGIGWGMNGTCPGPGLLNAFLSANGAGWMAAFLAGYGVAQLV